MIEEAGLQHKELIDIKEPFIFQGIVSGFLVFEHEIEREEGRIASCLPCDDLVEQLIKQGSYTLN
ncbi:MAG: hypothetical protein H0U57_00305 [Tatlockia sp.]|nr:hypothetical protein [Tatlockia sp.]